MSDAQKRIVIVDDEVGILQLMKRMLSSKGYAVVTAGNGTDGLDLIAVSKPDLVIMDINLPDMDGLVATVRLRSQDDTRLVPIILMSGNMDEDVVAEAVRMGCVSNLHKPFSLTDLVKMIEQTLAKPSSLARAV